MSRFAPLRWLVKAYIEVMRGTPLLLQLIYIYYVLPEIGIRLNAFTAGVLGLTLNYSAYISEDIARKVLKEVGPIPPSVQAELAALDVDPLVVGNARQSFAQFIRNGETAVFVRARPTSRSSSPPMS